MEQLTLEQAAIAHAKMCYPGMGAYYSADKDGFQAGAEWQKEQLLPVLKTIAGWAGNLSDERLTSKTGPASFRGQLIVSMRQIAIEAIRKFEPEYQPLQD